MWSATSPSVQPYTAARALWRAPLLQALPNLPSYVQESTRLAQGKQVPYDGAMDRTRKYVQLSRDIIFEGEMLWRLDTQMLHSHTGFEPYAKEWTTFADEPPQLVEPLRIALSLSSNSA